MESDETTCPVCGVAWSNKWAKGQHFKRAHPEEYNEWVAEGARIGRDKRPRPPPPSGVTRTRWTSDEDKAMAEFELAHPELSKNMNQAIHKQVLPLRTQGAVNSRRRTDEYKKVLREITLKGRPTTPPPSPLHPRLSPPGAPAPSFVESLFLKYARRPEVAIPADPDDSPSDPDESVGGESSDSEQEEPTPPRNNRVGGGMDEGDESDGSDEGMGDVAADPLSRLGDVYVPDRVRQMEAHSIEASNRIREYAVQLNEEHGLGATIPNNVDEVMLLIRQWVGELPEEPRQRRRDRRRANRPDPNASGAQSEPRPGQGRARRGYRGGRGRRRPGNPPDARNVPDRPPDPEPRTNRAQQYRLAQQCYKTSRKDCAKRVLKGQPFTGAKPTLPPGTAEFWTGMFGAQSPQEGNSERANPERLFEDIGRPISPADVLKHSLGPGDSAAGPDRVTKAALKRMGQVKLAYIYNCLLMLGSPGPELAMGRTTLIPKKDNPTEPGDFRPITITSHITRGLHKILSDRMGQTIPLSRRQKGFVKGINGCAANAALLHALIKRAKEKNSPEKGVALVFLDCAKAFDSVSHDAIRKAAAEKGLPPLLVKYIANLYTHASTTVAGENTPNRKGVLQGDPLSSHLFNYVLDLALKKLSNDKGSSLINGSRICFIAFADDLVLVGKDPTALKELLEELQEKLRPSGLTFGLSKCASLTVKRDRQRKPYASEDVYSIGGEPLKWLGPTDLYKYLGMQTGYLTGMPDGQEIIAQLEEQMSNLRKAPLKPQQKVWILQNVVVGKLRYQLALCNVRKGILKRVDRILRAALRDTLKLPKDVPTSLLHAPTGNGGLALASMVSAIPIAKVAQLRSFAASEDPALLWLVANTSYLPGQAVIQQPPDGRPAQSLRTMKSNAKRDIVETARASIAGKGLEEANGRNCPSGWITSGNPVNKGYQYVGAIKTRMGAIPSKARVLQGQRGDRNCKFACRLSETNDHVLQQCVRTYQPRNVRHDRILDLVVQACEEAGFLVAREPLIEAEENRRPDIVLVKEETRTIWVLDAQIVSSAPGRQLEEDLARGPPGNRRSYLDSCDRRKIDKYNTPALIEAVRRDFLNEEVNFGSVTVNNRGVIAPGTVTALARILPAPKLKPLLRLISLRTLELSWAIWSHFNRSAG